jgi:hypothetical protein
MAKDPVLNALNVLLQHVEKVGPLFISATSEQGDQAVVLVSMNPKTVKEMTAWNAGDKPPGFGQRELWARQDDYAKRVDALEVGRHHLRPGPEFVVYLPDMRDGLAVRRLPLKAQTFGAALAEADARFPLPAWWAAALDELTEQGGGAA